MLPAFILHKAGVKKTITKKRKLLCGIFTVIASAQQLIQIKLSGHSLYAVSLNTSLSTALPAGNIKLQIAKAFCTLFSIN
jgi:hypothetical protein